MNTLAYEDNLINHLLYTNDCCLESEEPHFLQEVFADNIEYMIGFGYASHDGDGCGDGTLFGHDERTDFDANVFFAFINNNFMIITLEKPLDVSII